jgi:transposase
VELLDLMDRQSRKIEVVLKRKYGDVRPVQLLMTIPGIGFVSALSLYGEIWDVKRFSSGREACSLCWACASSSSVE